jgi:hypothetical protein
LNWLEGGLRKTMVPAASLVFEIAETTAELNKQIFLPFLKRSRNWVVGSRWIISAATNAFAGACPTLQVDYVKLDARFTHNLLNDKASSAGTRPTDARPGHPGHHHGRHRHRRCTTLPVLWVAASITCRAFSCNGRTPT